MHNSTKSRSGGAKCCHTCPTEGAGDEDRQQRDDAPPRSESQQSAPQAPECPALPTNGARDEQECAQRQSNEQQSRASVSGSTQPSSWTAAAVVKSARTHPRSRRNKPSRSTAAASGASARRQLRVSGALRRPDYVLRAAQCDVQDQNAVLIPNNAAQHGCWRLLCPSFYSSLACRVHRSYVSDARNASRRNPIIGIALHEVRISRKEGQRFTATRSMVSRHVGPLLVMQDVYDFLSVLNSRQRCDGYPRARAWAH